VEMLCNLLITLAQPGDSVLVCDCGGGTVVGGHPLLLVSRVGALAHVC
jgi:hypothetical protein